MISALNVADVVAAASSDPLQNASGVSCRHEEFVFTAFSCIWMGQVILSESNFFRNNLWKFFQFIFIFFLETLTKKHPRTSAVVTAGAHLF